MSSKSLSGALRSKIGLKKATMVKLFPTVGNLLKEGIPVNERDGMALRTKLLKAESAMTESLNDLNQLDNKWLELIQEIQDDNDRAAEEKLYTSTALDEQNGYQIVMDKLQEFRSDVKIHIQLIQEQIQNQQSHDQSTNTVGSVSNESSPKARVKLPKIELPKFSGDRNEWPQFWSLFSTNVHDRTDLSGVEKYSYLLAQIEGIALDSIQGLIITNENYEVAVKLLKARFEKPKEQRIAGLYGELRRIPACDGQIKEKWRTYDSCEKILRQLEQMGEDLSQNKLLTHDLLSKYPDQMISYLQRHYKIGVESTLTDVRSCMEKDITESEKLSDTVSDLHQITKPKSKINAETKEVKNIDKGFKAKTYYSSSSTDEKKPSYRFEKPGFQSSALAALETRRSPPMEHPPTRCYFCGGDHFNSDCPEYKTVNQRRDQLRKFYRCDVCMCKHDRNRSKCPIKISCFHCRTEGEHRSALCPKGTVEASKKKPKSLGNKSNSVQSDDKETNPKPSSNKKQVLTSVTCLNLMEQCVMLTSWTTVINQETGQETKAKLIFDSASHRTYINTELAKNLNLTTTRTDQLEVAIFGAKETKMVKAKQVHFGVKHRDGKVKQIDAHITPIIANFSTAHVEFNESDQKFFQAMKDALADDYDESGDKSPEILIRSDYFWDFILGARQQLQSGLYLIPSSVGLLIAGKCQMMAEPYSEPALLSCISARRTESEGISILPDQRKPYPEPDIDEFWKLETIGISKTEDPTEIDDEKAMEKFHDTLCFENGRYQVTWPWIEDKKAQLPTNYELAIGRFKSLLKRLQVDPYIIGKYKETIELQMERQIIEKVPPDEIKNPKHLTHYLPHHPVVAPQKTTTKVRIVYDASAKVKKQAVSLNECMYWGPVILPDLCEIIIRFRMNKIGIIADIEKAFLQLSLQESERDVTRFFWLKDESKLTTFNNLDVYRFCRVTFGMISSPFLLAATIQHHLSQTDDEFLQKARDNTYVDNVITGLQNDDQGIKFYDRVKQKFSEASMNLTEWCSYSAEVMQHIPKADQVKQRDIKVLGIKWDSEGDDTLRISNTTWNEKFAKVNSKREVLHAIASIYDPLGFFQPCLLKAKIFLQKMWKQKLEWDQEISDEFKTEWTVIHDEIQKIFDYRIPRYIGNINGEVTIVAFTDASANAYATVVYVRIKFRDKWQTNLVYSKSRLAPKANPISIPRLELMGTLIGKRASEFVRQAIEGKTTHIKIYVCVDSQCVLAWLKTDKQLSRFVTNRVTEIKNLSNAEFLYVKSADNPADECTRGQTDEQLTQNEKWWYGPKWLSKEADQWPTPSVNEDQFPSVGNLGSTKTSVQQDIETEFKKPRAGLILSAGEGHTSHDVRNAIDSTKFSSWRKLLRVTAICLKFLKQKVWNRISDQTKNNSNLQQILNDISDSQIIKREDLQKAKVLWMKSVQRSHYGEVLDAINKNTSHQMIDQLGLKVDNEGILRSYSRFENAQLADETKNSKLIPRNDHITFLIVNDIHERALHVGVAQTLCQVRQEYWIPQGRVCVRQVLRKCLVCKRYKGHSYRLPNMPSWPRERVADSKPFQFTGLDYLGPINVKVNEQTQKMHICLFTCLATRAIHLEWISEATAQEFLNGLIRFISRRGMPEQIISDNAPQFRVVKSLQDRVWHQVTTDSTVLSYTADHGIQWKFTTELAPWQGGFYERLVGIVKSTLKIAIGRRILKWQEFITLIAEVEAITNSRPISYLYGDVDSNLKVLRPIDFLIDQCSGIPISSNEQFSRENLGEAGKRLAAYWKKKRLYLRNLWKTWYDEYLLSLRERGNAIHRNNRSAINAHPSVDDIVLVHDDDVPRGAWKLARVTKLITSTDSKIRSAEVKLPNGITIRRSLKFLYPLEVENSDMNRSSTNASSNDANGQDSLNTNSANDISSQPQAVQQVFTNSTVSPTTNSSEAEDDDDPFYGFTPGDVQNVLNVLAHYDTSTRNQSDDTTTFRRQPEISCFVHSNLSTNQRRQAQKTMASGLSKDPYPLLF